MNKYLFKNRFLLSVIIVCLFSNLFGLMTSVRAEPSIPTFTEASVHDPSVVKVEDMYYVFGSHLAAAKSEDLMNWEQVSTHVSPDNPLFENVVEELEEAFDWARSGTLWAADVRQIGDKFYMYYNACEGSSPRSAMGLAIADDIEGPYVDQGIFLKSGQWDQESENAGEIYNPVHHPNVIDPHAFFDANGDLWLLYGSYSGGIFILEMDAETGLPIEEGYGTHLIGGNHARIEGPFMQYDEETGYYYLHLTFGGLDAVGGYNMRVMRSENPDGPFYDTEGNLMSEVRVPAGMGFGDAADAEIAPYGLKLVGNYLHSRSIGEPVRGNGQGYVSPGHNSVYTNENGEAFLIFHSRFPFRGEAHEIRVHRLVMNRDGWPVLAPHRYAGESIEAIAREDVIGSYKFVNHGKDITNEIVHSELIILNEDGTISGAFSGEWEQYDDYYISLTIEGSEYNGVLLNQWNASTEMFDTTFSAISEEGVSVWGSKDSQSEYNDEELVNRVRSALSVGQPDSLEDLELPSIGWAEVMISWSSSIPNLLNENGEVIGTNLGDETTIELEATLTKGDVTATKTFSIGGTEDEDDANSEESNATDEETDTSNNEFENDNTTTYLIIGGVVVIALLGLFYLRTKNQEKGNPSK